jgi:hypothetical protein
MRKRASKSKAPTIRPHFIPPLKRCAPMRRNQKQPSVKLTDFSRISPDSKHITGVLPRIKICLLN